VATKAWYGLTQREGQEQDRGKNWIPDAMQGAPGFELPMTQWREDLCQLATNIKATAVRDSNAILNGKSRAPTMRKPFDLLAEGLVSEKSRAERI
jgi:hypothetical protein